MNQNKLNHTKYILNNTLIGEKEHREFISFLSHCAIALRGGSLSTCTITQRKRISNSINLLTREEKKQLIFSGTLLNN